MSVAMANVSESAQALIDSRLETIERILFDRVPRQDRLTIVSEVESRIHDMLSELGVEEATNEDVLAVLTRLDPPEAYLNLADDDVQPTRTTTRQIAISHPSKAMMIENRSAASWWSDRPFGGFVVERSSVVDFRHSWAPRDRAKFADDRSLSTLGVEHCSIR